MPDRRRRTVLCRHCGKTVGLAGLHHHLRALHGVPKAKYQSELALHTIQEPHTVQEPLAPDSGGLRISRDAMAIAISGLEKIQAEIAGHIADCRSTLDAPLKRKPKGVLSEAQLNAMRANVAKGRAARLAKHESQSPPMEFWPNGEPKYRVNPDGSVRLTSKGLPWKRLRRSAARKAAYKSHIARGLKSDAREAIQ